MHAADCLINIAGLLPLHTDGLHGFRLVHDLHVRFGKPQLEALTQ